LQVLGLTIMRLLIGTLLRKRTAKSLLAISFVLLFVADIILLKYSEYFLVVASLILLGMGLAAGFPVMLGIVGEKYAERSGTAFSFVLLFALTGNILLNFLMGQIAMRWGIQLLPVIIIIELIVMFLLVFFILNNLRASSAKQKTMFT